MHVIRSFAFLSAVLLSLSGGTPAAEASHGCNLRDVQGSYGYTVNGTNVGAGLVAAVGLVTADGEGHLTASDTVSANGLILRRSITGSYTVNPNCTGAALFTDNFGQTTHLDFVIVARGSDFQFIQTDPATVTTGLARRQ
jgi:hypothetical protein